MSQEVINEGIAIKHFFFTLLVVGISIPGCQKPASQTVARKKVDRVADHSSDADQSKDSPESSSDDSSYLPIFTPGLDLQITTNRMEKNFARFHKKMDKSELVHFPSAGLRIYQPDGIAKAVKFSGFVSEKSGAAVNILTNPFSAHGTTKGLVARGTNESGILFIKNIIVDGQKGVFFAHRKQIGETKLAKFTSVFGNDEFSWIINASFPQEQETQFGERLLKSVLNVRVSDQPRLPPGKDVDFTLRANRLVLTDGFIDKLVFTKKGTFPDNATEPIFEAGRIFGNFSGIDKLIVAERMAVPGAGFEIDTVSLTTEVTIDGLKGYELIAVGKVLSSDEPLQMYSVTLFHDDSLYVMNGWIHLDNPENYIREFRSIAHSFERKSNRFRWLGGGTGESVND